MGHRLKVYLPSQTKDGERIASAKRSQVAARVKSILSGLAGGCTSQEGKGSWVDPFTGVVDEDVELIETYFNLTNRLPEDTLREIVDLILVELDSSRHPTVRSVRGMIAGWMIRQTGRSGGSGPHPISTSDGAVQGPDSAVGEHHPDDTVSVDPERGP